MTTKPGDDELYKAIIQWGNQYLSSHGYKLQNTSPENIIDSPWSYIVRFDTTSGYIYLKYTPKLLALEAPIFQILRDQFNAPVPEVIAHNVELNCFLMRDAGRTLREILKQKFDLALFIKAIETFSSMQQKVADHIHTFIDIGVPDWRLDKLPDLYMELLTKKDVLIADGLSEDEISQLEQLLPKVSTLCKTLSGYAIKPSIVQPDFNDNNTLVADISQAITIIDLGEIAISHPFFSLINVLYQAKKHHGVTESDDRYLPLLDACLKDYQSAEPKQRLLDAFSIANILIFVYGALCGYRLWVACDKGNSTAPFQGNGRPSLSLKQFLHACKTNQGYI